MKQLPLTTLGVEIGQHVLAICQLLGLDPNHVARLDIRPQGVTVEVFKLDDEDRKCVDETGVPATRARTFEIRIEAVER